MTSPKHIRLQQLIQFHGISHGEIEEWVEYGFFELHREADLEVVNENDLDRVERIIRLSRDLGVNSAGIDIILRLREKIERLQKGINREDF